MYAVINGYMDEVPVERVKEFEEAFHRYLDSASLRPAEVHPGEAGA